MWNLDNDEVMSLRRMMEVLLSGNDRWHEYRSLGDANVEETREFPFIRPNSRTVTFTQRCHNQSKWEIDQSELELSETLGEGSFGIVRKGKWQGKDVAVKLLKFGQMSHDEFIREAKIMMSLNHPQVVKLHGVSLKSLPIFIVTEFMKHGALSSYLRRNQNSFRGNIRLLTNMSYQVCQGMEYLENNNFIHRDLAARNCLVGSEYVVKVADFGLTRYVPDDVYSGDVRSVFAGKWASPEVLRRRQFSSKSDVWSFGILMWEVFSYGQVPYGLLNDTLVAMSVTTGSVLKKPIGCPKKIYEVMRMCWETHPEERPSFRTLITIFNVMKSN